MPVYLPVRMRHACNTWSHTEHCRLQRRVTNPVAALSNSWVCGPLLAGTAGSNPVGGMDVFLLGVLCVVRSLCVADHSCRGVLLNVVWSIKSGEALAYWRILRHGNYIARCGINWIIRSCEWQDWLVPLTQRTVVLYTCKRFFIYICF